jgi:hypothetical protein
MANPKNTFLTKERQEKADDAMKVQRMRERDSISKGRTRDIKLSKPGAPYYRDDSSDTPDEAVVRAKGQGKYMSDEVGPLASKLDEGVLAPAARTLKNVMAGKRGEEVLKDIDGDAYYKRRTKEEGDKAVSSYRGAKENQKEYGMKKGGMAKAYAKGGDVQSESSKLDQKNAEMDKAQEEGYKRYLADQEQKKKENIESRKTMPMLRFGLDMLRGDSKEQKEQKKAKGGAIKSSASARGDGCAQRGKTKGRMV